jgi:response regulator RpfG family c-di-GMP phosphodiesterase
MSDYLEKAMSRLKSIAHMEAEARIEIRDRERETLNVLSLISDHKDPETARHTTRVGLYAALLSELRGDSREEVDLMRWAAPLHDIGKVGIPDAILMQSTSLSENQQSTMKNHVLIGHSVLKNSKSPILRAGADIALSHHERWDGSGYPSGLKGTDINIRGRITGLADVFDALTTVRPYKEAWPFEQAMDWIRDNRDILFDPEIIDLFLQESERVEQILNENSDDSPEEARYSALT